MKLTDLAVKEILETIPAIIILYGEEIVYVNRYTLELTGYKEEEIIGKAIWDFCPIHCKDEIKERVLKRIKGQFFEDTTEIVPFKKKNDDIIYLKSTCKTIKLNERYYGLLLAVDITTQVELEEKLKENINELSLIFRYSPDIIVKLNKDGIILFKSYATKKLGYNPRDVINKNIFDYIHPEDKEKFKNILNLSFKNRGKTYKVEYRVLKADKSWAWLEGNLVVPKEREEAFLVEMDITDKKIAEEKIFKLVYYDPLTNLPNKILFLENLKRLIEGVSGKVPVIVFKISNIDDFKAIYPEDLILNKIKNVLQKVFKNFIVGKTLTNEFLLAGITKNLRQFDVLLDKFNKKISEGLKIGGSVIFPAFNMGISLYPKTSKDPQELLNQAFIAFYESVRKGKNQIVWYSEEVQNKFERNEKIIKLLPNSIKNKELKVFYQPIVSLKDRKIIGFETLIRWFSKELGYVPPGEFIPIAEETDFIKSITEFVIKNSIKDILKLDGEYFVSVNFSSREFEDRNFINNILKYINKYNFPSKNFVVEITERTAMKNPDYTKEIIQELKKNDFKIAIDDFGTGYSNMNYLIEFDIDKVKIDKDFVVEIAKSTKHLNVVKLIIEISHEINALSLAEGIETKEILDKLIQLNCDEGQGYLFSPPLPFDEIKNLIGDINERRKD